MARTINNSLSGYYTSLKEAEAVQVNGKHWIDITPFLDYLLGTMEECIVTSIKEDYELSDNQKLLLRKMEKRGKGAEITISRAADMLKISQAGAGRILNVLTEMGYLEKTRRDRKNIYILQ